MSLPMEYDPTDPRQIRALAILARGTFIERLHRTGKERTKVMRPFHTDGGP